ncbi:kinase-like domain-containing protein [Zychaea mexicana]|uniref:kinase-like domain-containing protein n=1 Tax=Zychaea mexicana TaxID=64656 RepID=UPI0022FEAB13|nr:kinase-like domain-containing protein [Zychaea mexicana]KAI9496827.1 kinase-like domain-containing protein [Zychaea mexicana]
MPIEGSSKTQYVFLDKIGDGAFGQVFRARDKATRQIASLVAIKTVRHKSLKVQDTSDYSLREYRSLSRLDRHPNIVQLYKTFVATADELHLVMEYINGGNLYQLIHKRSTPFEHVDIRRIFRQILQALEHIHGQGLFHRDLKPENILVSNLPSGESVIKLADFGLARPIGSQGPYTDYICTRWYRAPEILLRARTYSYPVDLWAAGTLFAELITLNPLFPGNTEIDQLYRICAVLGSPGKSNAILTRRTNNTKRPQEKLSPGFARQPNNASSLLSSSMPSTLNGHVSAPQVVADYNNDNEWREGAKLANRMGFAFPQTTGTPLQSIFPTASPSMIDLLRKLLYYDPQRRIAASEALEHSFFHEDKRPRVIVEEEEEDDNDALLRRPNKKITKRPRMDEIEAVDLLTVPSVPLQVCPDWDMYHHNNHNHNNSNYYHPPHPTTAVAPVATTAAMVPIQHHHHYLDTVAHYGKQLTTWQQHKLASYTNGATSSSSNNNKHASDTLYTISSPYPTVTTTTTAITPAHALAECPSSSSSTDER